MLSANINKKFNIIFRKNKYISSASLSALAWKRFKRNKSSLFFLFFIGFSILVAIFGYLISPDSTPYANEQFLELSTKKPGFTVKMLKVHKNEIIPNNNFFNKLINGRKSKYHSIPIYDYKIEKENLIIETLLWFAVKK